MTNKHTDEKQSNIGKSIRNEAAHSIFHYIFAS